MFFEILNADLEVGQIGCASSRNLRKWNYRKMVLSEEFHLSYPYVFEWGGEVFMVPESYQANEVRLYRAVGFPDRWQFECALISGVELVDASLFRHNGRWWMFAGDGAAPARADNLRLFFADDLTGRWNEHPCSPIVSGDSQNARPAGRVIQWNGSFYRLAQKTGPYYGMSVRSFRIDELTDTRYAETAHDGGNPVLEGAGTGWNAKGMHHMDSIEVGKEKWVAAVDGWYWGGFGA